MTSYSLCDSKNIPLDIKLDTIFNGKTDGFYIELGANDGLCQSNTAYFEKYRNWKGILIEPSVMGYNKCLENRPQSISLNYACVSNEYKDEYIYGDFQNNILMGSVDGNRLNSKKVCAVKAITLEKILDTYASGAIDLLSLDTEGYELNILKGLNLTKYRPHYMLIEVYTTDYEEICNFLKDNDYALHSNFSNYNKIDNSGWDGSHNDYLFYDTRRH